MKKKERNIYIEKGYEKTIKIELVDEEDEPVVPEEYAMIHWAIMDTPDSDSDDYIIHKTSDEGINLSESTLTIKIDVEDTSGLEGTYYHEGYIEYEDNEPEYYVSGLVRIEEYQELPSHPYEGEVIKTHHFVEDNKITVLLDGKLDTNYKYEVYITDDVEDEGGTSLEEVKISFTSEYYPLFTSMSVLRRDLARYIESMDEDTMYQYARENSFSIRTKLPEDIEEDIDWDDPPFEVKQYVRYKTIYDIVLYYFINEGDISKFRLADLDVDKNETDIQTLLDNLKDEYKSWLDICLGHKNRGRAGSQLVIRSTSGVRGQEVPFDERGF